MIFITVNALRSPICVLRTHKQADGTLEKQFCGCSFIPTLLEGARELHVGHQGFLWPWTTEATTSASPSPNPSGYRRMKCNPKGNRLKLVPVVQVTHSDACDVLNSSAQSRSSRTWIPCSISQAAPQGLMDHSRLCLVDPRTNQVSPTLCISVFPPKSLLPTPASRQQRLLGALCRTNPSFH